MTEDIKTQVEAILEANGMRLHPACDDECEAHRTFKLASTQILKLINEARLSELEELADIIKKEVRADRLDILSKVDYQIRRAKDEL